MPSGVTLFANISNAPGVTADANPFRGIPEDHMLPQVTDSHDADQLGAISS
jgi:hypothetical protein